MCVCMCACVRVFKHVCVYVCIYKQKWFSNRKLTYVTILHAIFRGRVFKMVISQFHNIILFILQ